MTKAIYFDMDGTLADLYNVPNWLEKLRAEDYTPYVQAKPMVDMERLAIVCRKLQKQGYLIGIITWLGMFATRRYKRQIRVAKDFWLLTYLDIDFDEVHMVKYGTPKHLLAKVKNGILVDDNKAVCNKWERYGGMVINAKEQDIVAELEKLL